MDRFNKQLNFTEAHHLLNSLPALLQNKNSIREKLDQEENLNHSLVEENKLENLIKQLKEAINLENLKKQLEEGQVYREISVEVKFFCKN